MPDKLEKPFSITNGQGTVINPGQTRATTVTCPQGGRILSGGFEWTAPGRHGSSVISSGPLVRRRPEHDLAVRRRVDSGEHTLLHAAVDPERSGKLIQPISSAQRRSTNRTETT
jgi:hypothetical protein